MFNLFFIPTLDSCSFGSSRLSWGISLLTAAQNGRNKIFISSHFYHKHNLWSSWSARNSHQEPKGGGRESSSSTKWKGMTNMEGWTRKYLEEKFMSFYLLDTTREEEIKVCREGRDGIITRNLLNQTWNLFLFHYILRVRIQVSVTLITTTISSITLSLFLIFFPGKEK